jgi:murein L,D-transpeptidase YcbB/YkuD
VRELRLLCASLSIAIACATPPPPAQSASGPNEALRERVERIRDDPSYRVRGHAIAARRALPELYANRGFTRAWTSADARAELERAIRDSAADGLDPEDYHRSALEELRAATALPEAPEETWLDYDVLQTDALARLVYHLLFGKLDPADLDPHWSFEREVHHGAPAAFLQALIDSPSLFAAVEREKPQHEMYRDLRAELARYRALRERGGWEPIPGGPTLAAGDSGARVAALRARLAATGHLAPEAAGASAAYDAAVEAAVREFQRLDDLEADGVVGRASLEALNRPIDARIAQIEVNLERGRWLLHDLDPTFVVVNAAGFRVYYLRDHTLVWSARAQVGRPYRQTPTFRATLSYLVLNPTWTVPPGIFAADILPELRRDPGYLARRRLRVVDAHGRPVTTPIDWTTVTPGRFPYLLRQDPGPDNALGRVKFMFPNRYAVYLHDTPSRALFERTDRTFSSGCIRIENPLDLAALLLEGQAGWDAAAIERELARGETRTVTLERKVPVLVAYWTAWVDRDGKLHFHRDVYGRDAQLHAALAARFQPGRELGRLRPASTSLRRSG